MAQVDASIPLQAQTPNISGAFAQGQQISAQREAQKQESEMRQFQLQSLQRDQQNQDAIKLAITQAGGDVEKALPEITRIDPTTGLGLQQKILDQKKTTAQIQKSVADADTATLERQTKLTDAVDKNLSPVLQLYQTMVGNGVDPKVAQTQLQPKYIMALQDMMKDPLLGPIAQKAPTTFDPNAMIAHQKAAMSYKDAASLELQNRRLAQEQSLGQQNIDLRRGELALKEKMSGEGFSPEAGDLMAALSERGVALPAGFRSKQQQAALLEGLIRRNQDKTPDQIADMIKSGQLGFGASKTEASVLGRREAAIKPVEKSITKPGGFLDQAEKAVNEVNLPKLKAAGAMSSWTRDQLSDPKLANYKAAVAELRAEYALVLSKGGQVTDAARHEAGKVIPDLITPDQFKSIRNTVMQGIEASKGGVEESLGDVTGKPASNAKTVHWDDLK